MKKLLFLLSILLISCAQDEVSVTNEISKIVTIYETGSKKNEPAYGVKIETAMPEKEISAYMSSPAYTSLLEKKKQQRELQNGRVNQTLAYPRTTQDFGVIPNSSTGVCPSWSEPVGFYMDCEDNNAASNGNYGGFSTDGNRNLWLRFCRVNPYMASGGAALPSKTMVLQLGNTSPYIGKTRVVVRYFDNEDNNVKTNWYGDVAPSAVWFDTEMHLYNSTVTGDLGKGGPDFGFSYWTIGRTRTSTTAAYSSNEQVYSDDEDNGNVNWWRWDSALGTSFSGGVPDVMVGGLNTGIYMKKMY